MLISNKILKFKDRRYRNPPKFLHPKGEWISDYIRKNNAYFELNLLDFLRRNTDLSTVIDIGANIGNHSKFFTEFGDKVYSIEPIRRNFELLKKNAPSAKTYNLGVGNEFGQSEFLTYESGLGNSYSLDAFKGVINDWGQGIGKELVNIVTLDSLDLPPPTLVKLDVEGSELRALKGARKLLNSSKSVKLCIEIHQQKILEGGNFEYSRSEIRKFLNDLGFKKSVRITKSDFLFSKI